ncbi:MAG TPA: PhzF family phenazine biosynthesis protein, partial [Gemmatimonadales bacterium]|nr:PhzF family phenazine biosynthesis protein [Gemmatimonadales bacterium]
MTPTHRSNGSQAEPSGQPIVQIDAFTTAPFGGNPAGVCLLTRERDADWMQLVAREMNLAET